MDSLNRSKQQRALRWIGLILVVAAGATFGYVGWKKWIAGHAAHTIRQSSRNLSIFKEVRFENLETDFWGRKIHLRNVWLTPVHLDDPVAIDEIVLQPEAYLEELPTTLRINAHRIRLPASHKLLQGAEPLLGQMGIETLTLDLFVHYEFSPIERKLDLKKVAILAPELGILEFDIVLRHVDLKALLYNPQDLFFLLTVLPRISIERASLYYKDHALFKMLVGRAVESSGHSQTEVARVVTERLAQLDPKSSALQGIADGLGRFLNKPGSLCSVMAPERPVPIGRLVLAKGVGQAVDMLGLTLRDCNNTD